MGHINYTLEIYSQVLKSYLISEVAIKQISCKISVLKAQQRLSENIK